jgi:hypothetical protein
LRASLISIRAAITAQECDQALATFGRVIADFSMKRAPTAELV